MLTRSFVPVGSLHIALVFIITRKQRESKILAVCNRDNDCPRGNICLGNRCTAGCRAFSDCENGFVCVEGTCRQVAST